MLWILLDKELIRWSDADNVNVLKHLFQPNPHPEDISSALVNWSGQSGKEYPYEVHPIEISLQPLPGNYIYAKHAEDGRWIPIYIAQTRNLHQRFERRVWVADAVRNGATHVHAHYCFAGQAARCIEERDLNVRWHPVCSEASQP